MYLCIVNEKKMKNEGVKEVKNEGVKELSRYIGYSQPLFTTEDTEFHRGKK